MLKKFFLIVCGSFVGAFLALIIVTLLSVMMSFVIFGSLASSMGSTKIEKNSIMYLRLEGTLNEREATGMETLATMMPSKNQSQSLSTLVKGLKLAKDNNNIKGLYIDCRGMAAGMA